MRSQGRPINHAMELEPMVVQGLISIPLTSGLVAYTLMRKDRSPLHSQLAVLLSLVVVWMTCLVLGAVTSSESEVRRVAFHVETLTTAAMAPLFLITMGGLSRAPIFERSRRTTGVLLWMFALTSAFYLSDSYHHLFFDDLEAALRNEHPATWGGPAYWALQLLTTGASMAGIGITISMAVRGRTPAERNRALMVLGAVAIPVAAHLVYVAELLPIDFSLAPGTLGITAFFFVQAINRYEFIVVHPVMRQDVIEHISDGMLLADPTGIVLDANAAAERALGSPHRGLRGQLLAEALAPLDAGSRRSVGERIAALPLEGGRFQEEIRTPDGRSVEITAGAVAAQGNQPAGRFVSLRDRSEQRQSERLLQQSQKLESIGIMAAGVAHEVNNPLAYVRSNLVHLQQLSATLGEDLKLDSDRPGSDLLEFPEILEESIAGLDRIAGVVRGMLRFSRPSSAEACDMDVNPLVDDAIQLAALHTNRSVRVERRLAEGLPQVQGSAQGFVQVVLNLLLNAKQALCEQADGLIIVESRQRGCALEILVQDNGPGVPDAALPQIFDPFFTTRDPGQGTGLGLSIAFDIVRNHGGTLEYSAARNGGACFTVSLPLEPPALDPPTPPA